MQSCASIRVLVSKKRSIPYFVLRKFARIVKRIRRRKAPNKTTVFVVMTFFGRSYASFADPHRGRTPSVRDPTDIQSHRTRNIFSCLGKPSGAAGHAAEPYQLCLSRPDLGVLSCYQAI